MAKKKRKVSRIWTPEERKAFGEKMKAARAKSEKCQPTPLKDIPAEVKELSGITEPENVDVFIKNPISINGISYGGKCNVPRVLAGELKYRSDLFDKRKKREQDSTDHGFHQIGVIR